MKSERSSTCTVLFKNMTLYLLRSCKSNLRHALRGGGGQVIVSFGLPIPPALRARSRQNWLPLAPKA